MHEIMDGGSAYFVKILESFCDVHRDTLPAIAYLLHRPICGVIDISIEEEEGL